MKAIRVRGGQGPAESLYQGTAPVPSLANGEALIKVKAFGLNRMDIIQRNGGYVLPPQAPETLGVEFSGTIAQVESGYGWDIGDEVFGLAYGGAYAEYLAVSTRMLIPKPKDLSWEKAAAIPETWMTATQAMFLVGNFKAGESILWHAGASAVAIAGIQLSRASGASQVFATTGSDGKVKFCVEELGVTAAFNYKTQPWPDEVLRSTKDVGVDVIIDLVGASHFQGNIQAASRDARIAHLGQVGGTVLPPGTDIGPMLWKRIHFQGSTLRSRDLDYQSKLKDLFVEHALPKIRDGSFKVHIEKTFSWTDIIEAHKLLEGNTTQGKLVCTID
ncbi:hypothetical protein PV08_10040 [Exophiala spinifera]|uniref:Enoyl reductase (ER) domain-containing protein n=1 Tax=Exophiala spinifera TaxID=91928 RepID=A0A0D1Y759_9EURO|nr:uncharacterized protein PV08_10040 [Exophiala spinifera]KIW10741.1 hypothetical protein PV08_10040 [Exophiala spinifera]